MPVSPCTLTDKDEIRALLMRDPIATAYQLGDLDDSYFRSCTWYAAGSEDELDAIALLYTGLSIPVLLTHGSASAMAAIIERFHGEMPGRMMAHMSPDHVAAVVPYYNTSGATDSSSEMRPMLRMGLLDRDFRATTHDFDVRPLALRDTGEIIELYQYYPDNFFEPAQLATGHYYGVRVDGKLVSVAGVHVFAPDHKVGCLGNIVSHPGFRGRGLSTACTSHLCERLIDAGVELLALNVDRQNTVAVRVYEKLGFTEHNTYLEGMLHFTNRSKTRAGSGG